MATLRDQLPYALPLEVHRKDFDRKKSLLSVDTDEVDLIKEGLSRQISFYYEKSEKTKS